MNFSKKMYLSKIIFQISFLLLLFELQNVDLDMLKRQESFISSSSRVFAAMLFKSRHNLDHELVWRG